MVLGLFRGDPAEVEGPACQAGAAICGESFLSCDSAYPEFVAMFGERGFVHSICVDDYDPFFSTALASIATTCEEFEPEG